MSKEVSRNSAAFRVNSQVPSSATLVCAVITGYNMLALLTFMANGYFQLFPNSPYTRYSAGPINLTAFCLVVLGVVLLPIAQRFVDKSDVIVWSWFCSIIVLFTVPAVF